MQTEVQISHQGCQTAAVMHRSSEVTFFLGEDKQVPTASENREVRMEGGKGEGEG